MPAAVFVLAILSFFLLILLITSIGESNQLRVINASLEKEVQMLRERYESPKQEQA